MIGLGIAGAVVLLLIIVGVATVASRVSGGTALSELRPGDCFDTAKALVAEKANKVSCAKPHTHEVAGPLRFPGSSDAKYPGQSGILDFGRLQCPQLVRDYFGTKRPSAIPEVFVFGPNQAAWRNGDRTVVCSLRERSGAKRTGSYRDG